MRFGNALAPSTRGEVTEIQFFEAKLHVKIVKREMTQMQHFPFSFLKKAPCKYHFARGLFLLWTTCLLAVTNFCCAFERFFTLVFVWLGSDTDIGF